MKIVSMDELETLYGRHSGAPIELDEMSLDTYQVRDIMVDEVADLVQVILDKHISQDIYSAYEPHETYYGHHPPVGWREVPGRPGYYKYQRRFDLYENYDIKILGAYTLFMTSDTQPNQSVNGSGWNANTGGFIQMIGTNPGPIWRGRFARPALQNAQEDLDTNPYTQRALAEAFARGMKRYMK